MVTIATTQIYTNLYGLIYMIFEVRCEKFTP